MATERVSYQVLCRTSPREAQLLASCLEEAYALRLLGEIEARRESPEREHAEPTTSRPSSWPTSWGCVPL
jgi:hypothetical protein